MVFIAGEGLDSTLKLLVEWLLDKAELLIGCACGTAVDGELMESGNGIRYRCGTSRSACFLSIPRVYDRCTVVEDLNSLQIAEARQRPWISGCST